MGRVRLPFLYTCANYPPVYSSANYLAVLLCKRFLRLTVMSHIAVICCSHHFAHYESVMLTVMRMMIYSRVVNHCVG